MSGLYYQSEEEGGLVGLERGLRVRKAASGMCEVLCMNNGRCTELLDQLQLISKMRTQIYTRLLMATASLLNYLLESFVVNEAGGIFWDIQLPFLDVLAELPDGAEISR